MSKSPPALEEKDESPKSFEFLPPRDPAAKCGLPFANSLLLCSLISALWVELWATYVMKTSFVCKLWKLQLEPQDPNPMVGYFSTSTLPPQELSIT